tara:strand:- start:418 stop:642 length:225 start_codon:yes stop_codon:yes gene_type:complete
MRGSRMLNNPFSKIIEVQNRMFQVKKILPESKVNINNKNWASFLKEYYYVDTILRANGELWMCNEIKEIEYEEI